MVWVSTVWMLKRGLTALLNLSHPDVLKYHQVLTDGNTILVVTDRCCGDLRQFITDYRDIHEPIPSKLMLSLLGQLAGALAHLHGFSRGAHSGLPSSVVLEPDNVLFAGDGRRVVLADFGFCEGISSGAAKAGDPAYMAPETLLCGDMTQASDVWSLGAIAYELATLRKPDFLGDRDPAEVFVDGWRPDLSGIADDLARSVLERMLVLDPAERPTARELARLLQMASDSTDEQEAQDTRLKEVRAAFVEVLNAHLHSLLPWGNHKVLICQNWTISDLLISDSGSQLVNERETAGLGRRRLAWRTCSDNS